MQSTYRDGRKPLAPLPSGNDQISPLAGHASPITALGGGLKSTVVVCCEADGSISLWDLALRRVVRTLGGTGGVGRGAAAAADHLILGLDDTMLIICTGQSLQVVIFFCR